VHDRRISGDPVARRATSRDDRGGELLGDAARVHAGPGQSASFGLRIATGDGITTYPTVPAFAVIPPGDVVAILVQHRVPAGPTIDVQANRRGALTPGRSVRKR